MYILSTVTGVLTLCNSKCVWNCVSCIATEQSCIKFYYMRIRLYFQVTRFPASFLQTFAGTDRCKTAIKKESPHRVGTLLNVMICCYIEVLERRCKAWSAISVEQCSSRKVRLAGVERLGIPYSEMTLQTRSKTSRSSSPCVRIR